MGWFSGFGSGNPASTQKMANAAKSVGSKSSTPAKGSPFSSKPGKGPGRYSGKK